MNVDIYLYKTRFEVKSKYDQTLVKMYQQIEVWSFNEQKKTWSFPNEQLEQVQSFLKSHDCKVTLYDKSTTSLIFGVKNKLFLKAEFDEQIEKELKATFPNAVYDSDENDWEFPSTYYLMIKTFLAKNSMPFTYVNYQIELYMQYIKRKLLTLRMTEPAEGLDETDVAKKAKTSIKA
mgnify:CR=1 FL=1